MKIKLFNTLCTSNFIWVNNFYLKKIKKMTKLQLLRNTLTEKMMLTQQKNGTILNSNFKLIKIWNIICMVSFDKLFQTLLIAGWDSTSTTITNFSSRVHSHLCVTFIELYECKTQCWTCFFHCEIEIFLSCIAFRWFWLDASVPGP